MRLKEVYPGSATTLDRDTGPVIRQNTYDKPR